MTAPSPAAAGLPAEDVERVARALWETAHARFTSMVATWESTSEWVREHYRALAAAALAEMRPTAAEEAVKRVEALADDDEEVARMAREYEADKARRRERDYWHTLAGVREQSAERIRAALAPVSHDADGGERR